MLGLFRQPPASPRPRLARPAAEALEERSVPAVFTVTNRSDHNPGSLRVAVQNANARLGHDTIRFARAFNATITLTTGDIDITDDLTIEGIAPDRTAVSGNNASRIFDLGDAPAPSPSRSAASNSPAVSPTWPARTRAVPSTCRITP